MRCFALAVSIALTPIALMACATSVAAAEEAADSVAHVFPFSYDVVKAAAVESVGQMNVSVRGYDETEARFQITFVKLVGGITWGDAGVVDVVRVDDGSTRVVVDSEPGRMRNARERERQFADQVYASIAQALARQRLQQQQQQQLPVPQ